MPMREWLVPYKYPGILLSVLMYVWICIDIRIYVCIIEVKGSFAVHTIKRISNAPFRPFSLPLSLSCALPLFILQFMHVHTCINIQTLSLSLSLSHYRSFFLSRSPLTTSFGCRNRLQECELSVVMPHYLTERSLSQSSFRSASFQPSFLWIMSFEFYFSLVLSQQKLFLLSFLSVFVVSLSLYKFLRIFLYLNNARAS
jgi:hypothetical protein